MAARSRSYRAAPRRNRRASRTAKKSTTRKAPTKPKAAERKSKALPPPTPSEAAFERAFAALDGSSAAAARRAGCGRLRPTPSSSASTRTATEYLRDPYSTIGDAPRFHTKIAGVSFEGRQDIIAGLRADAALELRREPDNPHDPNAIAVHYGNLQLGFFNKKLAAHFAPLIDARRALPRPRRVADRRPAAASGASAKHRGVNIFVERDAVARIAPGAATAPGKPPGPAMASDELPRPYAPR